MQSKADVRKFIGSILSAEGGEDLCFPKAYTKYANMGACTLRFSRVLVMLSNSALLAKFPELKQATEEFISIFEEGRNEVFRFISPELAFTAEKFPIIEEGDKESIATFLSHYAKTRTHPVINTMMRTCSALLPFKTHLQDIGSLDARFLERFPGSDLSPVPDLPVNFKYLISQGDDNDAKFVVLALHKIYTICYDLYQEFGKVDIDTSKFVEAVEFTIKELRKKVTGCDEAFKQILGSTEMLRDRYSEYYKDYVGTMNSMIIAENFIVDVSQSVSASPRVAMQFKRILDQMRKLVNSSGMSSKYKDLINSMNKSVSEDYEKLRELDQAEALPEEETEEKEEKEDIKPDI